jgi:spoIIIJ-associated protein
MNTRPTLEVIAPSVEEAVEKGVADLGLTPDDVEVEVLDIGTRGLFGLGNRQARVRLIVKDRIETRGDSAPHEAESSDGYAEPPAGRAASGEPDPVLDTARATVAELLDKMGVEANVAVRYGEAEDDRDRVPVIVDVHGEDLSILIGKRAETLNALQYITNLIVSKELGHSVPLLVDVEGYRVRRAKQLRQLARRMADQVAKTGRRMALEPMPANERRVIHMELRGDMHVTTESVGEEPYRKITILPKD